MDNMYIWKVEIKDTNSSYNYVCNKFIVAAPSIPQAIETIYQWWHKSHEDCEDYYERESIPFYLRSSNMIITKLCSCDLVTNALISKEGFTYND